MLFCFIRYHIYLARSGFADQQLGNHTKLLRQFTRGMLNTVTGKSNTPTLKRNGDIPEDSAKAKQSREMILQTKLIVVEILQVIFVDNN